MLTLIVSVLFGLMVALFAMQNTNVAGVTIAQYRFAQVPVYIIMIASLLIGILLSWFISLVDGIGSFFSLQKKERSLNSAKKTIAQLEQRLDEVEKENALLKGEKQDEGFQDDALSEPKPRVYHPNFLERFYTPKTA